MYWSFIRPTMLNAQKPTVINTLLLKIHNIDCVVLSLDIFSPDSFESSEWTRLQTFPRSAIIFQEHSVGETVLPCKARRSICLFFRWAVTAFFRITTVRFPVDHTVMPIMQSIGQGLSTPSWPHAPVIIIQDAQPTHWKWDSVLLCVMNKLASWEQMLSMLSICSQLASLIYVRAVHKSRV